MLKDAPPASVLVSAIAADPGDLRARHLLGVRQIVDGDSQAGLEQFLEMLRRDRGLSDGLPRKALIDAFRIVEDEDLVGAIAARWLRLMLSAASQPDGNIDYPRLRLSAELLAAVPVFGRAVIRTFDDYRDVARRAAPALVQPQLRRRISVVSCSP